MLINYLHFYQLTNDDTVTLGATTRLLHITSRPALQLLPYSTTRHVLSYVRNNIQSAIWWSERVDVSLVLPAGGCLRGIGGCRCTPITPGVVLIYGLRWMGRRMIRGGTR